MDGELAESTDVGKDDPHCCLGHTSNPSLWSGFLHLTFVFDWLAMILSAKYNFH